MLKNYLITSIRSFRKNKFTVTVSILGLSLTMAICIIAFLNYNYNGSYNQYFENAESLHKINSKRIGKQTIGDSPASYYNYLQSAGYQVARYHSDYLDVSVDGDGKNKLFTMKVAFTDKEFLEYFKFRDTTGEQASLGSLNEVIFTEETALKMFGSTQVENQFIQLKISDKGKKTFRIKSVIEKPPHNTSFHFSIILPIENYFDFKNLDQKNWSTRVNATFVNSNSEELASLIASLDDQLILQESVKDGLTVSGHELVNILDWPSQERDLFNNTFPTTLHPSSVIGIASSALAILLLACFNFVNTSMAISGKRLKEVGIRKTFGGQKKHIVIQFMLESLVIILLAASLSVVLLTVLIPAYNQLYNFEVIQLAYIPWYQLLLISAGLLFTVVLLAGVYPAFYISGLSTLQIFKNKVKLAGNNWLTKGLLTFQFFLCFYNLFSLFVFVDNAHYQETLSRGYAVKKVINIPLNESSQYNLLEESLNKIKGIEMTGVTHTLIGFGIKNESVSYKGINYQPERLNAGENYLQTMNVSLRKGSWFSRGEESFSKQIIVNQLFEKQIGEDLLDKNFLLDDEVVKIIGVVDDFNTSSIMLKNKMEPLIISPVSKKQIKYVSIRASEEKMRAINEELEVIWYQLFPDQLYKGFYQDEVMKPVNMTNEITITINSFIAIVSVIISTLGLYTLVSLVAQRRQKEFGVRKVLGGSARSIVYQLGKEFYLIILVAAVLGIVMGFQVLNMLLDIIFAYHVDLNWHHAFYPLCLMVIILTISLGYKIWKTIHLNPTEQLRTE